MKLNQFEEDWAQAPIREKNLNISKLSEKTIVISGDTLVARALVTAFLSANDKKKLNNKIYLVNQNTGEASFAEEFSNRADFCFAESQAFNFKFDIWIEAGFLNELDFQSAIRRAECITGVISKSKNARVLLLSNAEVYGEESNGYVFSEYEFGKTEFSSQSSVKTVAAQCVECLFSCAARQFEFDLSILRIPQIICDFSNSRSLYRIVESVALKNKIEIAGDVKKMSFVSINDLITAVFYVLVNNGAERIFNVACDDAVSSYEIFSMLRELFETADISLSSGGIKLSGAAIKNTRLKKLGWNPTIGIKDALLISVHAYLNSDEVFMFPDAYDGKLKQLQKILLGYLKEVDRICTKHNIEYSLGGGTLLGAIRHKGFIPWDDDADVMMTRDNYDRFLSLLPKELPSNLTFQSYKSDEPNHFPFTKIRISNTILSTEFTSSFINVHEGIFLDVLAQDKTSNNKLIRKLHIHMTGAFRWLVLNKWRNTRVDALNPFSACIANAMKSILPMRFLEFMQNKLMKLYKNSKKSKYLFDSMGRNIYKGEFPKEWLDETIRVDFEDTSFPVPKEYEKYLEYLYGDYNEMIPVSQRHVSHDIIQIDLGEYEGYRK